MTDTVAALLACCLACFSRTELTWLHVQVIERPDPTQQGKSKPTIRNVFSEVTPELDTPHVGPTNPPSAAAAKVSRLPKVHVQEPLFSRE